MSRPEENPTTIYGKTVYKPLLFVVSAPSGAGKTSLCREIARKSPWIHYSVSYTTREPRPGEKDGIDYRFVSRKTFQDMAEKNLFVESAEVYGNFYGTSRQEILDAFERGHDVLVDIDIQGARKVRESRIENISIYILPPSHSVLRERLSQRGQDSEETMRKRLERVKQEIEAFREYDYLIFNADFGKAVEELHAVIVSEHHRTSRLKEFMTGHYLPCFDLEPSENTKTLNGRTR